MKKIAFSRFFSVTVLLLAFFLPQANALSTHDRILSAISVQNKAEYSVIHISFNFPVRYVRHYPLNIGKEVRIQLEPIAVSLNHQDTLKGRESLFPPTNNSAGVERVQYEGSDFTDPTLTVVFSGATNFEAKQGNDYRSLTILVPIKEPEQKTAATLEEIKPTDLSKTETQVITAPSGPGVLTPDRQEKLLTEGVEVMVSKDFTRAIQIYTKLLESPDQSIKEQAQFLLALAREQNNHLAHAKAEYRNYLTDYPDGPNAEQARDRLKALMSARPFGDSGRLAPGGSSWEQEFYGSISQFYTRDESYADDSSGDNVTINISSLTTSLDAFWRLENDKYKLEALAIGSQEFDLENQHGDESRINTLYLDFENADQTMGTRWGRQSGNSGGVLGRFDGALFGYQISQSVRLNLVAGFPVNLSSDELQTDKYFYGINFDLGRFSDHWEFNVYFINQIADDLLDRRAIGGEVRYLGGRGSFFSLIDYDLLFHDLNIALFAANYLLPNEKTRLNFSADFRKSPVLSTSNGLIGQTSPSLSSLEATIGESALWDLAKDRTLDSGFITLGASHPISDNIQIAGDISWARLNGSDASAGVEAIDSTGDEFFYSFQIIGSNIIKQGDIGIIGFRYADSKQRDTYTLDLNTRYRITNSLLINPRLQIDYRVNKELSGDQFRFRPSMRVEYMLHDKLHLEFDGGITYLTEELPGVAEDNFGYFLTAGIRWDF